VNGSNLAFIGDAVLALVVKEHLINEGYTKSKELQQLSEQYLSANAQAGFAKYLLEIDYFNAEEHAIFLKGRNHKSATIPKNSDVVSYRLASGLEAVFGYYHLNTKVLELNRIWETYKKFVRENYETISIR
jgi:ribonuclease-3 family protein